jgi:hypothetical protein
MNLFCDRFQSNLLFDHSSVASLIILHIFIFVQFVFILMCSLSKFLFLIFFEISLLSLVYSFLLTNVKKYKLKRKLRLTLFNLFISWYFFSTYFCHFCLSNSSLKDLIVSIWGILERVSLILYDFWKLKLILFWTPFYIFDW